MKGGDKLKPIQKRCLMFAHGKYYTFELMNTEESIMSIALNYQLSIFGKFAITPSPEAITGLMSKINQETQQTLLPNMINSQQIEIPSNKITTVSNLGFVSQDQQYSITILNERIDINYNRVNDVTVSMDAFYSFAIKALTAIIDYSGILSNRLAMNIQQVCEMKNFSDLKMRGKSFVKTAAYYNDKDFSEWSLRTNGLVDITINESQETLNVITDISSGQDVSGQQAAILFHVDINTLPQNQNMRFGKQALEPFVQNAAAIASTIIADVERLISNED